jgi:hypothetical protein
MPTRPGPESPSLPGDGGRGSTSLSRDRNGRTKAPQQVPAGGRPDPIRRASQIEPNAGRVKKPGLPRVGFRTSLSPMNNIEAAGATSPDGLGATRPLGCTFYIIMSWRICIIF